MTADFYVVEVLSEEEKKYFYNRRVLLNFPDFARKFSTITNAAKSVKQAGITNFKILGCINGTYLYC